MIIKIALLKEDEPRKFEMAYDACELDLEFVDLHYIKKVSLSGIAERIRQTITFRGTLRSRIEQVCARCLEPRESDILTEFNLSYDIANQEAVDTTGDLRDILLLEHPERFLCRQECPGICSQCGANLNREKCRCGEVPQKV